MYIIEVVSTSKSGKVYRSILLRESYREEGRVKNRTLANLSKCRPEEVAAIKLALKHKENLAALESLPDCIELREGPSIGAIFAVYQIAKRLGIVKALGNSFDGKLALWQVMARVIEQGSRLSAVRLAQIHAACDVLDLRRGFDENDLYENLSWLDNNQERIERRLFLSRRGNKKPDLFFYDVTSSYLEGENNPLAAYGYSRDKKRGKKQLVIGLLCDECGDPVSISVFPGNTSDSYTVETQIQKVTQRFVCQRVTFVGDRGMIKRDQITLLSSAEFYYITAITKPQIRTLLKDKVIKMDDFDDKLHQVIHAGVRYILRRNPHRAKEIADTRQQKRVQVEALVQQQNTYLVDHPRAHVQTAKDKVCVKIKALKIHHFLKVEAKDRTLHLTVDESVLKEKSLLDGCYVIKTDLPFAVANEQFVHDRYKDLYFVEQAFRTCKTEQLEIRPVYVHTCSSTKGHALVVMLAYLIVRELRRAWGGFDLTVSEGLAHLSTLCSMEMKVNGHLSSLRIPTPRQRSGELLEALQVQLPSVLSHADQPVVTRKKLTQARKEGNKS